MFRVKPAARLRLGAAIAPTPECDRFTMSSGHSRLGTRRGQSAHPEIDAKSRVLMFLRDRNRELFDRFPHHPDLQDVLPNTM